MGKVMGRLSDWARTRTRISFSVSDLLRVMLRIDLAIGL